MILVIPSIEIVNRACLYCIKGESGTEELYDYLKCHLEELCKLFRKENTKVLHITDLDSFTGDRKKNEDIIFTIINSVDVPFQLYADFDSFDMCKKMLDSGVSRILLDKLCIVNPIEAAQVVSTYKTKIALYVKTTDRVVSFNDINMTYSDIDFIALGKSLGFDRIVYYDEYWETNAEGADLDLLKYLAVQFNVKITIGNGVTNPPKLHKMKEYQQFGVDSVIISKPLYENNFSCQKIWRLVEAELDRP